MGRSPQRYISSYEEIGPPVLVRKSFEGFYHIGAWRPHLSCDHHHIKKNFISMYLRAYSQNLVKKDPVVSENGMP